MKSVTKEMMSSIPFQYANDVLAGKIVTGKKIKKAVERFYELIESDNDYYLDNNSGMEVINFFPTFLKHTAGDLSGQPFHLSPYQQFTYYNVFAWKRPNSDGRYVRLIRTVYEKVARKNGKTAGLGGLGLYCQGFDEEYGAEVYVGATMEKQAKVLWTQAVNFIKTSAALQSVGYSYTQSEIRFPRMLSTFKTVSKEAKSLDGLKPSTGLLDEYHAHPTDAVREVIESGMGNRLQPLLYIITTAGFNPAGVCKEFEDVVMEILNGNKKDDTLFAMVHDLDEDDDWEDPKNWAKANPNLNVSVYMDFLLDEFRKAKNQPSKSTNFKTKHLNMWVDAPEVWIPSEIWRRNKVEEIPIEKFILHGAYAGLDLSTTTDITALLLLSEPDEEDIRYLKPYFFCPKATIDRRSKEDRVPYRAWVEAGHIIATEGDTVDYDVVQKTTVIECKSHNVIRVELDQWNAAATAQYLASEDIEVSYFSQAIANISHPTKQFEKLVYDGKIKHDGNPVFDWMLGGCIIYRDPNENIKVHKGKSHANGKKRVDDPVAAIMALGGSLSVEESNESKYNKIEVEDLTSENR